MEVTPDMYNALTHGKQKGSIFVAGVMPGEMFGLLFVTPSCFI